MLLFYCSELAEFQEFVGRIVTTSGVGGDTAEDVMGGLKVALRELSWRSEGTKVHLLGFNLCRTNRKWKSFETHVVDILL